jgi:hypothetical protein
MELSQDRIVERVQAGVVRTNCLDCLDRTNYCQTKLSARALEEMLAALVGPSSSPGNLVDALDLTEDRDSTLANHRELWAGNGDYISFHYTGAESTHASALRKGAGLWSVWYRGKASLTRFYMQNF